MKYIYIYVYIYIQPSSEILPDVPFAFFLLRTAHKTIADQSHFSHLRSAAVGGNIPCFFWWISCEFMTTHWFQVCLGAIFEALFQIAPNRSKPLVIYDLLSLIWIKSKNMAI
jgi:hypothetical protein